MANAAAPETWQPEDFEVPASDPRVADLLTALKLCVIRDPSLKHNAIVMAAIAQAEG